ncbi:hypothetical protein Purlil1_13461 [Purpureocillium lilacinum]|uniref:Tc1-like transposase DDE domain-containing protein n=1 Tax=Purpureocillium lilacinum TaxID=33203 RepID=A0ABR0BDY4_PURLI|nr:hypothetical protein Purlil1_13461 [Purpureocillium lilacinum]
MAPNLAVAQHFMIQEMLECRSRGEKRLTNRFIARHVGCSPRSISRHATNRRLFGSTKMPFNGAGRPNTITPVMLEALCDELDWDPCLLLREMVQFLLQEFGVDVSRFSVARALRKNGWTQKTTQIIAKERNQDLRDDYMYEISQLHSDQLVFIDETGLDKSIGIRRRGWARQGRRPRQIRWFHRDRRTHVLPAYAQDGIIHFRVYKGATDHEIFEDFIEELLPYCGRYPEPKSVLIMDNASFHHTERIEQMCHDAGVVLIYLPPYSPDFNPIEEFFGELKTYIKHVWADQLDFITIDFAAFVEECVEIVGQREISAEGHFRRAGIYIE